MPAQWIENGPVSLPTRSLAYWAGAFLVAMAFVGAGLGIQAAIRPASGLGDASVTTASDANTLTATPLVDLTPAPVAKPAAADKADSSDADAAKADDLAAQTAKAQALQAKPTGNPGDIDSIMTSATEKPPAPVKSGVNEAPPNAPVKSDVPF
jgi:hypothetical protein